MSLPLILAAGPGDVITVAIFLIAAISGLMNFIKDRRAAANRQFEDQPKQNRPRTREEEELQSEIEAFLTEVSSSGPSSSSGSGTRSRTPQQSPPRPQGQKQRRKKAATPKPERTDAQQDVAQRQLPAGNLGGVGQRHMENSVQNRHIDSSVAGQQLQPGSAFNASAQPAPKATAGFAAMLSQAGGVRNAIILSEVLGPPVAKRKR